MCGLCGLFGTGRPWLEINATLDPGQVRSERRRRLAIIRQILAPARIAVDDWQGALFVLRGATGRTEIVADMFDLWRKAEVLGRCRFDPLAHADPDPPARGPGAAGPGGADDRHGGEGVQPAPDIADGIAAAGRMPVHVLTGFLGSGKTTLLNRLLRDQAFADTAVLINEFGAIAIDHHLVEQIEPGDAIDIVVLKGGCACCAVRGDLVAALRELHTRAARGTVPAFRRVVLETTGLADPAPILFTLASDPALRHKFQIGGVVTTVDVVHAARHAERHPEWRKQVAVADHLVITKTDLLGGPAGGGTISAWLGQINPAARISDGQSIDLLQLLCGGRVLGPSPIPPASERGPAILAHSAGIASASIALDGPIGWPAFAVWLTQLLHAHGENILRFKALLDVEDSPALVAIDGLHHFIHPPLHLGTMPQGRRRSRLVFIGQHIAMGKIASSLPRFLASFPDSRPHEG